MRTGSTRTDVAYIWPSTLHTRSSPRLVYLDLNHWISLAKAYSEHQDGRPYLEALHTCINGVSTGEVLFPLSLTTYVEISKIQQHRQRRTLCEVIETISRYMVVTSIITIRTHELEASLDNIVGPSPDPIGHSEYLDWGVCRAMGLDGSLKVMTIDGRDVTDTYRQMYHRGPQAFDEIVTNATIELNRRIIQGPMSASEEQNLTDNGWNPRRLIEPLELAASEENAQVNRFNDNPKWRRGRVRDVIIAREIIHEYQDILTGALHRRGVTWEGLSHDLEGRRKVFDVMPSFDVSVTLKTDLHRNPHHHWKPNDICDIYALSATMPYCDVVVTDKEMASHATHTGLASRLNTVVLSDLRDLPQHL